jgi:hypothetical protein
MELVQNSRFASVNLKMGVMKVNKKLSRKMLKFLWLDSGQCSGGKNSRWPRLLTQAPESTVWDSPRPSK